MSGLSGEVKKSIGSYISSSPLLLQIANFLHDALLWKNYVTFGIVGAIVFLDYLFAVNTQWRLLPYIFMLSLELYLVVLVLGTVTPFLRADPTQAQQNLDNSLEYLFNKLDTCCTCNGECQNPLTQIAALRNFSQTPYWKPTCISVGLLLCALVSAIFSGSFLAFITIFGVLLAPGIISHNLHLYFQYKIWNPMVKPQLDKYVKPQIDKYWAMLKGEAPPATGSVEAPAPTFTRESAPPATEAPTSAPASSEGSGEGELDINNLLGSIGALAKDLGGEEDHNE